MVPESTACPVTACRGLVGAEGRRQAFRERLARAKPAIDDYLPNGDPLRTRVLIELVHIDLELRLKAGETARVEEYLARYPELTDPTVTLELIAAEHELRRRREPDLTLDEYLQRFPQYRTELREQHLPTTVAAAQESPSFPIHLQKKAPPEVPATRCWVCSAAAAWEWCTRPGSTASTGPSP